MVEVATTFTPLTVTNVSVTCLLAAEDSEEDRASSLPLVQLHRDCIASARSGSGWKLSDICPGCSPRVKQQYD